MLLYKHKTNIIRIAAIFIGMVFTIAITPWSVFHSHKHRAAEDIHEKNCLHKYHVKTQDESCLLCQVHFEKNFIQEVKTFKVHLNTEDVFISSLVYKSIYISLIATSLRGPPVFS